MKSSSLLPKYIALIAVLLSQFFVQYSAWAQSSTASIVSGERLSSWLLRQTPPLDYPLGLSWRVPQERAAQTLLQQNLDRFLALHPNKAMLRQWLNAQTVTGRVILREVDPRWLEVHPQQDPILDANQSLVTVSRPKTVTVLRANGTLCAPQHVAGATARSYLDVCGLSTASKVWVAQPDGSTAVYGVGFWNAQQQPELAPGAWVWGEDGELSDAFSEGLIQFLATLGPAQSKNNDDVETGQIRPVPTPAFLLRPMKLSASDWGEVGLLQTPTARMKPAGDMRLRISKVKPYTRNTVMFQPTSWFEAGFRYTDISNRLYDDTGVLNTTQSFKDKSLDFKLKFKEESRLLPALALGIRDVGGTGLFSSEYLVASKRFGDIDLSLGLGWGNLGSRADFFIGDKRPIASTSTGGQVGTKAFFRGPAALFGGIQYQASSDWSLKLELDGNSLQKEPLSNPQDVRNRWNAGATYFYSPATELSFGWERGNTLMLGLTFSADLDGMTMPKALNPPKPKFQTAAEVTSLSRSDDFAQALEAQTGWVLISKRENASAWLLEIAGGGGVHRAERLERLNGLVQAKAPSSVVRWDIKFIENGMAIDAVQVDRAAWIESQTNYTPLSLKREVSLGYAPTSSRAVVASESTSGEAIPSKSPITVSVGPSFNHILGGPDAFVLYKLGVDVTTKVQINPQTWIDGTVDLRVQDNYKVFKFTGPSNLPRVRTYAREFETTSRLTMPNLQVTHVSAPAPNHFNSVYAGYLESMFAGVGGEWLYRPWRSPVAFGIDVNHVYQRNFEQNFGLRDYKVTTGHASTYWDTGISGLLVKLQVGQYLAGDRGATMDVSRRFDNGVTLGAYATKTNVSAEQFGEGSFDKGIYLKIPFDVMLPKYSDSTGSIGWQPLTRDGGARLGRQHSLYAMTSGRDRRAFEFASPKVDTSEPKSTAPSLGTPQSLLNELATGSALITLADSTLQSAGHVTKQLTHPDTARPWLWGAGLVLASTAMDTKMDRWALNRSGSARIAKLGNSVPLLLGLGALADLSGNGVGWIALQSAGFAFAANSALRVGFGRARPDEGNGNGSFDPLTAKGLRSGFPSNHTAVAFALATPFAQTYDMPWLYAAAGLTGLGRVQSRQHWLSDTVAGGVLGYAIGSVMTDQHKQNTLNSPNGRQLMLLPNGVAAKWWWQ